MDLLLYMLVFIFITGLVIGSFLNVVILRSVSGESIVFPASKCPKCQNKLKWYHNIPVLSYIFLRGKCAFCKEHISLQYPFVEALTGILFITLFIKICHPFTNFPDFDFINTIDLHQIVLFIYSLIILGISITLSGTDFIEKQVRTSHLWALIGWGLGYNLLYYLTSIFVPSDIIDYSAFDTYLPILYSVAGAIIGFIVMEILARLGILLVGTRAFGDGDSYILAGIGAVFGSVIGCQVFAHSFTDLLIALGLVLVSSVVIQCIFTIPLFIKKLIKGKSWTTLISLVAFTGYAITYFCAQYLDWFTNTVAYFSSTIVLVALALYACHELLQGLKKNKGADGLYLPFGPALLIGAFIVFLTLNI